MTIRKCLFCERDSSFSLVPNDNNGEERYEDFVECPHCGSYIIPNSSMLHYVFGEDTERDKYLVSCYLNETKPEHDSYHPIRLSSEVLKAIVKQIPKTVEEKTERLLQYISNRTGFFGDDVEVDDEAIYSQRKGEASNLVQELTDLGVLKSHVYLGGNSVASLTMKGYELIKDNQKTVQDDKCFIAMWFDEQTNEAFEKCICPACIAAGYKPIRVDFEQYNGDITDKIIGSIRTTAFTIADFTGNRGGVYYESGFAKGLGKEVIMTCREDWFDGEEGHKVHFDVNHINMILWNNDALDKFREELKNRITATIGPGSYSPRV